MRKFYSLFFILFLGLMRCYSQDNSTKVLLVDYLATLENKFHVKFSSASKALRKVTIHPPSKVLPLKEVMIFLNTQTSLSFEKINNRYITITPKINQAELLNPIVLTRYLTNGLQKKKDGSIVLNPKKFDILPGLTHVDVMQAVQALPGIESENENINYINVRGGTNDQNLILWEGIKMYHSSHFFGLISAYNIPFLDNVEVLKNGTSSTYGEGISSTILLSNNSKINKRVTGGFGINFISSDAYVKIPISKKLQVNFAFKTSINNLKKTVTYNNYFYKSFQDSDIKTTKKTTDTNINSLFSFHDITSKIIYQFNKKNRLQFNFINIKNKLVYGEQKTRVNDSKSSVLNQEKIAFGLKWTAKWNSNFKTNINLYHTNYNINSYDETNLLNQFIVQKNTVKESNLKIENQYKTSNFLHTNFGIQLNESGVLNRTHINNPFFNRVQKRVLITASPFAEIEYSKQKTYLKIGIRTSYLNRFDKIFIEPRFVLKQKIIPHLKYNLLGEFKHQSVNQTVDFKDHFLGVENRRWILSNNTNIPIVRSKQISTGFEYYKNNFLIELGSFYKHVKGITASSQGFYNNFQTAQDYGNYKTYGTELLINKTEKKYSAWFTYTLSKNTYFFQNFTPENFPNNVTVKHSSTLGFNYSILKNLKISIGINWKKGNVFTKPNTAEAILKKNGVNQINYDKPNNENLSNYFRLDSSIKYNFALYRATKASLSLGILNVTNRKNIIQRYYKLNTSEIIEINNQSLKFTPNVSFRINF